MKFNSQICTTMEQSERLLALGLKKETADMMFVVLAKDFRGKDVPNSERIYSLCTWYEETSMRVGLEKREYIPAWSLHRLIEMLNYQVIHNGKKYEPVIAIDGMAYQDVCNDGPTFGWSGNLYTDIIDSIEWIINIEQFNKEYLGE